MICLARAASLRWVRASSAIISREVSSSPGIRAHRIMYSLCLWWPRTLTTSPTSWSSAATSSTTPRSSGRPWTSRSWWNSVRASWRTCSPCVVSWSTRLANARAAVSSALSCAPSALACSSRAVSASSSSTRLADADAGRDQPRDPELARRGREHQRRDAEDLGAVALDPELLHPLLDRRPDDRRQRLLERGELEARRHRVAVADDLGQRLGVAAGGRRQAVAGRAARDRVHQRRGVAPHHAGLGLGDRAVEPERLEQADRADRQRVAAPAAP